MNIILDTNILHQEGLGSRNMQLLSRLSTSYKINVYIPEIVKREYLSKKIESGKEDLSRVSRRLDNIRKWIGTDKTISNKIREMERQFKEIHQNIDAHILNEFENWVENNEIEVVEFNSATMDSILEDYFTGKGAFRKIKCREDFPDAMILTSINELIEFNKSLYVVVKDGSFRRHLNTIKEITTFESLSELYELEEIKNLTQELDSQSKRIELIKTILSSEEKKHNLRDYVSSNNSFLDSIYLEGNEIILDENFELDCASLLIEGLDIKTIEGIVFTEVRVNDDNSFSIDLSFNAEAGLSFVADYGSYIGLSENRQKHISMDSMNGEGWCDLSEEFIFQFSGTIEIWLDEDISPEQFKVHMQYISTEESELDIDIEIKHAELHKNNIIA